MTYHILNGDALREQFPAAISGERIIARECLVDGDITGESLKAFFYNRATFLEEAYGEAQEKYIQEIIPEFEKIQQIPEGAEVNLWFEYDLFCQVNMWFVAFLLAENVNPIAVNWIQPTASLRYGFGGMSQAALIIAYEHRASISHSELKHFAQLWQCYASHDLKGLQQFAAVFASRFRRLPEAVQAHLDRFPSDGSLGRPARSLQAIRAELGTDDFGPVFRAFTEREAIYGFGDLQVKRIFDGLER